MEKIKIMRFVKLLVLMVGVIAYSATATAQTKTTEEADRAFERGGYFEASKEYKIALNKADGTVEKGYVFFQLAESNRLMTNYEGALEWYKRANEAKYYKTNPELLFNYAEALRELEKFDEAVIQYNKYIEKGGDKSKANGMISVVEDAALFLDEPPTRYDVEPVVILNSEFFDYAPGFSSKKNDEIVFGTSRQASTGGDSDPITGDDFMDIFTSERDKKGKWSTPTALNSTVNTSSSEGAVTFDKKKSTMYFTRCEYDGKSNFACDIYYSIKQGKGFGPSNPMNIIDREANDSSQVGHPALTPDDQFLLFASDMPGGYGGKDLWYISYDSKSKVWGKPKNLGNSINTKGDEMFPYVHADGSLYFASNGHPGLGGLDIFKAASTGEMQFDSPSALLYPINSSSDDFGIIFEGKEDKGYFTSNRPGGKGKDDIYSFKMPPLEFSYIATVYDNNSGTPIQGAKVVVVGSDGKNYELTTDGNGGVSLADGEVLPETNFSIDVSMSDYIGTPDQFSTMGLAESTTFAREYFLKPIIKGEEYPMPLVLYPYNEAILLVDAEVNSKDSLSYLYDLMTANPTFVIQLESHTDTRGKDAYNMNLSQRRAETCVEYLKSRGIAADRLKAQGKGETSPIIKDKAINAMATQEEKEAAHQKNRRTVFKIISTDYVPKP